MRSLRSLGVIRVGAKTKKEANALIEAGSRSFYEHSLKWARVRCDDEERVFRAKGHRANGRRAA